MESRRAALLPPAESQGRDGAGRASSGSRRPRQAPSGLADLPAGTGQMLRPYLWLTGNDVTHGSQTLTSRVFARPRPCGRGHTLLCPVGTPQTHQWCPLAMREELAQFRETQADWQAGVSTGCRHLGGHARRVSNCSLCHHSGNLMGAAACRASASAASTRPQRHAPAPNGKQGRAVVRRRGPQGPQAAGRPCQRTQVWEQGRTVKRGAP